MPKGSLPSGACLNQAGKRFSDEDIDAMPLNLESYDYEEVDFSQNDLSDNGLKKVLELCAKCKKLRVLKLYKNGVTDEGAEYLAAFLEKCSTIEELHMSHNRFSEKGIEAIVSAVDRNRPDDRPALWMRVENNEISNCQPVLKDLMSKYSVCPRWDGNARCNNRGCHFKKKIHLPHFQGKLEKGGGKGGKGKDSWKGHGSSWYDDREWDRGKRGNDRVKLDPAPSNDRRGSGGDEVRLRARSPPRTLKQTKAFSAALSEIKGQAKSPPGRDDLRLKPPLRDGSNDGPRDARPRSESRQRDRPQRDDAATASRLPSSEVYRPPRGGRNREERSAPERERRLPERRARGGPDQPRRDRGAVDGGRSRSRSGAERRFRRRRAPSGPPRQNFPPRDRDGPREGSGRHRRPPQESLSPRRPGRGPRRGPPPAAAARGRDNVSPAAARGTRRRRREQPSRPEQSGERGDPQARRPQARGRRPSDDVSPATRRQPGTRSADVDEPRRQRGVRRRERPEDANDGSPLPIRSPKARRVHSDDEFPAKLGRPQVAEDRSPTPESPEQGRAARPHPPAENRVASRSCSASESPRGKSIPHATPKHLAKKAPSPRPPPARSREIASPKPPPPKAGAAQRGGAPPGDEEYYSYDEYSVEYSEYSAGGAARAGTGAAHARNVPPRAVPAAVPASRGKNPGAASDASYSRSESPRVGAAPPRRDLRAPQSKAGPAPQSKAAPAPQSKAISRARAPSPRSAAPRKEPCYDDASYYSESPVP